MNERIQELFNQAEKEADAEYQRIYDQGFATSWKNIFGRIYAELIVQECANFIEPLGDYCGGHGEPREPSTRECAEKLKQHFGIN